MAPSIYVQPSPKEVHAQHDEWQIARRFSPAPVVEVGAQHTMDTRCRASWRKPDQIAEVPFHIT